MRHDTSGCGEFGRVNDFINACRLRSATRKVRRFCYVSFFAVTEMSSRCLLMCNTVAVSVTKVPVRVSSFNARLRYLYGYPPSTLGYLTLAGNLLAEHIYDFHILFHLIKSNLENFSLGTPYRSSIAI
jgi:hypothetical protein